MKASAFLQIPFRNPISVAGGLIDFAWSEFFRNVKSSLESLGTEKQFEIENNKAVAADVTGLVFDKQSASAGFVDYVIQRVTTGGGATELLEVGSFYVVYKPTSDSWSLVTQWTPGPDVSGVVFTITSTGQVQYTSTNITGTASISKLTYRARSLAGKNVQYSGVGR